MRTQSSKEKINGRRDATLALQSQRKLKSRLGTRRNLTFTGRFERKPLGRRSASSTFEADLSKEIPPQEEAQVRLDSLDEAPIGPTLCDLSQQLTHSDKMTLEAFDTIFGVCPTQNQLNPVGRLGHR